jgi:myo-inositol catabolism protein IolC
MSLGFDQPLYILPFDQRESFQTTMFGWTGKLTLEQIARIAAAKKVIYDAFKVAVATRVPKDKAGILVDEQFGSLILRDATKQGFWTACRVEKSGQEEFEFEYGEDFTKHIEALRPTFCKVSVRYNPEGDRALNKRQAERLQRLSDYLHDTSRSLFMFELVVTAEKAQLRPSLMVQAIEQLQDAHVEPDVWKIEGLVSRADCGMIAAAARRGGREHVGCIVLGRGADDQQVRERLATASRVPGFIGFATGRAIFWNPLVAWRAKKITREEAVNDIARRYQEFVDIFEERKAYAA